MHTIVKFFFVVCLSFLLSGCTDVHEKIINIFNTAKGKEVKEDLQELVKDAIDLMSDDEAKKAMEKMSEELRDPETLKELKETMVVRNTSRPRPVPRT